MVISRGMRELSIYESMLLMPDVAEAHFRSYQIKSRALQLNIFVSGRRKLTTVFTAVKSISLTGFILPYSRH